MKINYNNKTILNLNGRFDEHHGNIKKNFYTYSGTPVQRCPSRTTAPLKRLFFCARMPFTLLRTPEERRPL